MWKCSPSAVFLPTGLELMKAAKRLEAVSSMRMTLRRNTTSDVIRVMLLRSILIKMNFPKHFKREMSMLSNPLYLEGGGGVRDECHNDSLYLNSFLSDLSH